MEQKVTPIHEKKRLLWIDAARGIAIFGIYIVNIGAFSTPYFLYGDPSTIYTTKWDQFILQGIDIFFQASFYTLFSLLFGFGLGIMKERILHRGEKLYAFLSRRMIILLLIGIVHALLLWHGDILFSYALVGIVSLLFLQRSNRVKISIGVLMLGGSVGIITFLYYLSRDYLDFVYQIGIEQSFQNYLSSHVNMIWMQNFQDWLFTNNVLNLIFLTFILLPSFLFGMVLAEKRWLHEPEKYKSTLKKWWVISFILFIALKMGPYMFGNPLWFSYVQDNIGGMFSALFYILSITLLAGTRMGKKSLQPFAYVGRMALTNYIAQSIISFILFYGIGFGWYGSISPFVGVIIVVAVYTCQIVWSKWWFERFKFGPLEWIWRSLTYSKLQPFRKVEEY